MARMPSGIVTFLFTDIEGSTRRWEQEPVAMGTAIARHDSLMRQAIETHSGYVFKTVGDAFCAVFATAADGLATALQAQRALAAEPWGEIGPLRVRMALHTGAAEERDADYFGPPVNRVARLLATGFGGQVLLSRATSDLVREALPDGAHLVELGSHRLKDLARPERIFQLVVPDLPDAFPPLKSLDSRPNNLPVQPTPLIGRENEVSEATGLLESDTVRLLTLTGPGGVGKTRLGLQVAAELVEVFPDGVWFVDLAALQEPGLVIDAIARSVGVREEGGQHLRERLAEALRDERVLLVLDNFEQVIVAAPEVATLLATCPRLKALVTSRVPLRVRGERELQVQPLEVPDSTRLPPLADLADVPAIRLFAERAQAVKPGFALDEANAQAVAAICARLDGLPLALELAAARSRLLSPEALLARLERPLPQLTRGDRDLPERQKTLRAAIAWSYDLLEPAVQALFRRLAVFAGDWTLDAAETVVPAAGALDIDVLDGLEELAEHSLVRHGEDGRDSPRFTMLAILREYALEELEASGEEVATRQAHADFYLSLAEEANPEFTGPDQGTWLDRLEAEHGNFRDAIEWLLAQGKSETVLLLGWLLWLFWARRGHLREGGKWLERGINASGDVAPKPRARALVDLGNISLDLHEYERARTFYEQSLPILRDLGERRDLAVVMSGLGRVAELRGELADARMRYEECLVIFRELQDDMAVAFTLDELGDIAAAEEDYPQARAFHEEALAIVQPLGDPANIGHTIRRLGLIACLEGDHPTARRHLEQCESLFDAGQDKGGMAATLHTQGVVAMREGAIDEASARFVNSLRLSVENDDALGIVQCLEGLAEVASVRGQFNDAAQLLGAVATGRRRLGAPRLARDEAHLIGVDDHTRTELGDEKYQIAKTAGESLNLDEAISLAGAEVLEKEPAQPTAKA